jgi:23S rRNA G2445 N2-methylase RlmL
VDRASIVDIHFDLNPAAAGVVPLFNETDIMKARVVVTCAPGVEDLLACELKQFDVGNEYFCPGVLISTAPLPPEWMMRLIAGLRLAHAIGWLLYADENRESLSAITEFMAKIDASSPLLLPHATYGVKGRRTGTHDFNSVQLATAVARGLGQAWGQAGASGLKGALKNPDFYVEAIQEEQKLVVAAMMTGAPLHHRLTPSFRHAAALDPTLAAAMLVLAERYGSRSIHDPMCGGGTILWEAARRAEGLPPKLAPDDELPLIRQSWFSGGMPELWHALRETTLVSAATSWQVSGCDRDETILAGARTNLEQFDVSSKVAVTLDDGASLAAVEQGQVDTLVVNPPYGVRVLDPRQSDELTRRMALAARDKGVERAIVITQRKGPLQRHFAAAGYRTDEMRSVRFGEMPAFIFCFSS